MKQSSTVSPTISRHRQFESITTDELNDFVVHLKKKSGMESNTVLHNVVIIAQFFKRSGRGGIMRQLHLPERTTSLPVAYTDEELAKFFAACDDFHRAMYSTFLMTGEQEVMYLFWSDISLDLRTARVTSKPNLGFTPKRCEQREVPITAQLVDLLKNHPKRPGCSFVFPSPTGNREQHMLDHCKEIAAAAGLDAEKFDLKTFRSTYATRMLRSGFDVRTVQHWMGHKSLETTMRYLVPASDVQLKLEQVEIPGVARAGNSKRLQGRIALRKMANLLASLRSTGDWGTNSIKMTTTNAVSCSQGFVEALRIPVPVSSLRPCWASRRRRRLPHASSRYGKFLVYSKLAQPVGLSPAGFTA